MRVLRIRSVIFILSVAAFSCYAQNLVPNPSFETFTSCPTSASQISLALPWQGVTTNSSDYYHTCGSGGAGIPMSGPNFQYARTGSAHAGIWIINGFGSNYREYLQVNLITPMQPDSCYIIEFYCNINAGSKWATSSIGAFFSNTAVSDVGSWGLVLQYTPQITSSVILNDTAGWTRVSGYYQAAGGEEYMTIGNFSTDTISDTLSIGGSYPGSYYFIEDVKVQKVIACDTTTTINEIVNVADFEIYPSPAPSEIFISSKNIKLITIVFRDVWGRPLDLRSDFFKENTFRIDTNTLPSGIYFIQISDGRSHLTKKFVKN